jgi:DNA-directed RNA polymerase specialized sigma subunit
MQDCIKNTSSDIRISMYMQEIQNKIQKVISKYEQSLDIDETCSQGKMIEFISKELNITNKKVEEVLNSYHIYQDFDESEIIIHES